MTDDKALEAADAQLFYQLDQWSQCGYPVAGQAKRRIEALTAERDAAIEAEADWLEGFNATNRLLKKAEAERDKLRERMKELEAVFGHRHIARQYPDEGGNPDACQGCGFDLRDKIHYRIGLENGDETD